jgi:hypothetical protein
MKKSFNRAFAIAAGMVAVVSGVASAQWTSDSTVNTPVADAAGSQAVPIIRPAADGGVWVFFFDSSWGTGLRPTIQRLDAAGNRMFPGDGIMLAARLNSASYTCDMRTDAAGNAYACFDDDSTGTLTTRVQKILPDGTLPWGGGLGVAMPNSTNSLTSRVAACADGTVVCMYQGTASTKLDLQRINANGTLGSSLEIFETGKASTPSDIFACPTGGDVAVLWVRGESTSFTARKGLKIQKFNSSFVHQWNAGAAVTASVDVYASGLVSSVNRSLGTAYYPTMVSDANGGAVISWYDGGTLRNCWLQHVLPDGTRRWVDSNGVSGLAMSSTPSSAEYRLSSTVAYNPAVGDYFVAFERSNTLQSYFGLNAQHVSSDGLIDWATTGVEIKPLVSGSNHKSFVNAKPGPSDSAVITWFDYQGANFPMHVKSVRLNATGSNVWGGELAVANAGTTKGRLGVTSVAGSDMLVAAWADGASGSEDIKAQNINMDGTLGVAFHCPADFNQDGGVDGGDVSAFFAAWESGNSAADVNADGGIDGSDVEVFFHVWENGGC